MSDNKPFISCKCITYGRVNTLVEALHSFLIQDYPEDKCELVIVNDYPLQNLIFDHPRVKIYNLKETFSTIGEKENYAIERCQGPLISVWDDDDIAMSNHLQNIAKYWTDDAKIIHWTRGVLFNEPNIHAICSLGNSGIVYSKSGWEKIGKSPLLNAGGDMVMVHQLYTLDGEIINASPKDKDVSWFYMWGNRCYHQSGAGTDDDSRPNIIERHSEYIEGLRVDGKIPTGDIHLVPTWNKEYDVMLQEYTSAG